MCTMPTVMLLDVSDVLNTVRQFLSWNINMHWQSLIPCGYRAYPTELLMAEMIDILSLNNGVAIWCCLQSATRAVSAMFWSIRLSGFSVHWGRMSSCKCWMLQDSLRIYAIIITRTSVQVVLYWICFTSSWRHKFRQEIIYYIVSKQSLLMHMFSNQSRLKHKLLMRLWRLLSAILSD